MWLSGVWGGGGVGELLRDSPVRKKKKEKHTHTQKKKLGVMRGGKKREADRGIQ